MPQLPQFISVHSVMIGISLGLAWLWRYDWRSPDCCSTSLQQRWQRALVKFVLSPLLVWVTAIAVLSMGATGQMMGVPVGRVSYAIAAIFLIYGVGRIGQLIFTGWHSLKRLESLAISPPSDRQNIPEIPEIPEINRATAKIIDIDVPFAAQIGFWRSRLFVSTGLLNTLDHEHIRAVLHHERAHNYYHDTFWFFWLGCCRQIMPWLPNTQSLWEELLLLRELRADLWASQYTDSLLLAESLVVMVQNRLTPALTFAAAFGESQNPCTSRLEERINFLLAAPEPLPKFSWRSFLWIGFALIPLIAMPLHY